MLLYLQDAELSVVLKRLFVRVVPNVVYTHTHTHTHTHTLLYIYITLECCPEQMCVCVCVCCVCECVCRNDSGRTLECCSSGCTLTSHSTSAPTSSVLSFLALLVHKYKYRHPYIYSADSVALVG